MYDSTITLFNYHAPTDAWYPTVFTGITLTERKAGASEANAGIVNTAVVEAILRVRRDRSSRDGSGAVRRYAAPKEYAALEDPAGYFTFTPERDFFAVGDYTADVSGPIPDAAYPDGFYQAMHTERDGVYTITAAVFYSLLPHFEIGGR